MPGDHEKRMLEKGWNNHLSIGPVGSASINQYAFTPDDNTRASDIMFDQDGYDQPGSPIAKSRNELLSRPKPLTAYASISTTLGFVHHEGTDQSKELDVIRYVLARESIILKLQNLCYKISQCDILVQSSMVLESELLDTLALMRATTVNFLEIISIWRKSADDFDPRNPRTFIWEGQNYTLKIVRDLDFLADQQMLVDSLQLTSEKMRANPLMLPNTLEEGDSCVDEIERAIFDSCGQREGDFFEERLRVRKAEKVLLVELENHGDIRNFDQRRISNGNNVISCSGNECKGDEMSEKENRDVALLTRRLSDVMLHKKNDRIVDDISDKCYQFNSSTRNKKGTARSSPPSPRRCLSLPRGSVSSLPRPVTTEGIRKTSNRSPDHMISQNNFFDVSNDIIEGKKGFYGIGNSGEFKNKGKGEGTEYHSDRLDFLTLDYEVQERARSADSQKSRTSQNNIAQNNMGMISLSSYEIEQLGKIEYPPQRLVLAAAATVVILLAANGNGDEVKLISFSPRLFFYYFYVVILLLFFCFLYYSCEILHLFSKIEERNAKRLMINCSFDSITDRFHKMFLFLSLSI